MRQNQVDIFMLNKGSLFPKQWLPTIREQLLTVDEQKWIKISMIHFKDPTTAQIISVGCGVFGADRFYLGHRATGFLKLLCTLSFYIIYFTLDLGVAKDGIYVLGLLASLLIVIIWYFTDIFRISNLIKRNNFNKLQTILN